MAERKRNKLEGGEGIKFITLIIYFSSGSIAGLLLTHVCNKILHLF